MRSFVRSLTPPSPPVLCPFRRLTVEYLLNVQNTLYAYALRTEKKVGKVRRSREALARKMRKREADAEALRRQVRQQKKTIKVYETLLQASAVSQGAVNANAAAAAAAAAAGQ